MRTLHVAALALNAALYVAFGYFFYSVLPITAPGLGTVRFWPQVIVPAIFAALFGPWVGGIGAAVGIFVNDLLLHGNPLLSLMAGVTSNFAMFWLIGYISRKNMDWKIPTIGFGLVTAILACIAYVFLPNYEMLVFSSIIVASYVILAVVIHKIPKWRGFEVGSMTGLLIGSSIIGVTVPIFSQFFAPIPTEMTLVAVFGYLLWTFASEIPFLLILGPPILQACYQAFPSLRATPKGTGSAEKG
jgi:uncharacterized membrane protein